MSFYVVWPNVNNMRATELFRPIRCRWMCFVGAPCKDVYANNDFSFVWTSQIDICVCTSKIAYFCNLRQHCLCARMKLQWLCPHAKRARKSRWNLIKMLYHKIVCYTVGLIRLLVHLFARNFKCQLKHDASMQVSKRAKAWEHTTDSALFFLEFSSKSFCFYSPRIARLFEIRNIYFLFWNESDSESERKWKYGVVTVCVCACKCMQQERLHVPAVCVCVCVQSAVLLQC